MKATKVKEGNQRRAESRKYVRKYNTLINCIQYKSVLTRTVAVLSRALQRLEMNSCVMNAGVLVSEQ